MLKETPADVLRKQRKIDPQILLHKKKRRVEVKLCEERIAMEDAGILTNKSIDIKINKLRKELLQKLEQEDEIEEGEIFEEGEIEGDSNNGNSEVTAAKETDGNQIVDE